ncbi:hypothetical protein AAMO2058_000146300 [Amorphochlora amoebiformis]
MSARKHTSKHLLEALKSHTYDLKQLEIIGKVAKVSGRELFEVKLTEGSISTPSPVIKGAIGTQSPSIQSPPTPSTYIARLPSKFKTVVWIKVGCFVVLRPLSETAKVTHEIVHVLTAKQVGNLKKQDIWPFAKESDEKMLGDSKTRGMGKIRGAGVGDGVGGGKKGLQAQLDASLLKGGLNRHRGVIEESSSDDDDED